MPADDPRLLTVDSPIRELIDRRGLSVRTDTLTVSCSGDSIYTAGTGMASVSVTQSAFSLAATTPAAVNA